MRRALPPQLRRQFAVRGEQTGQREEIQVWVAQIDTSTLQGRSQIDGLAELKTPDGRHFNHLSKGRYKLVSTGEVFASTEADPY